MHDKTTGTNEEMEAPNNNPVNGENVGGESIAKEDLPEEVSYEARIKELEEQLAHKDDQHLRAKAELANMRNRFIREREDLRKFAAEPTMRDLLPVLDSFKQAMAAIEDGSLEATPDFIKGVILVQKQLHEALEKHGLKEVKAHGEKFDPTYHQAVQKFEEEVDQEMVKDEFATGYLLHDRLLRPSMVTVALPKASDS